MTKTDVSGEARHAAHRRRFWAKIAGFMLFGAAIGFAGGFASGYEGIDLLAMPGVVLAAVIAALVGFVALSVWFYRSVDELETADNLWGSLFGFYFYAAALPSWWALAQVDLVPPVNHVAIYMATMLFAFGVYGVRKIINR